MKFRIVRESEFETRQPSTANPLRDTGWADKAIQTQEFETCWCLEIPDLETLRHLHHEIVQIESRQQEPANMSVDFLPNYADTPADCDGVIFICDC